MGELYLRAQAFGSSPCDDRILPMVSLQYVCLVKQVQKEIDRRKSRCSRMRLSRCSTPRRLSVILGCTVPRCCGISCRWDRDRQYARFRLADAADNECGRKSGKDRVPDLAVVLAIHEQQKSRMIDVP